MNATIKSLLPVIFRIFLLALGITIFTTAFLELVFAPEAAFKYYLSALLMRVRKHKQTQKEVFSESMIHLYYITRLLVQVTRLLASIGLFFSTTTSNRGWFFYPKLSLLSVALSFSLLLHQQITGANLFQEVILSDMYFITSRTAAGDMPKCTTSDSGKTECNFTVSFEWHQSAQCCGWKRAEDWIPPKSQLPSPPQKRNHSSQLPLFCCALATTTPMIDNVLYLNGLTESQPESCSLHSMNRFQVPCKDIDASSFEQFYQLNIFAHLPSSFTSSLLYSVFKMVTSLLYGLTSNHQLF